jgi:hypothetical protein
VPVLVELGLPFLVFAGAIVLVGLTQTQTAAHGSQSSQGFWAILSHALSTTFGLTTKIAHFVVSHFAAAQLRQLARWFQAMGTLTLGWFGINAGFAEAIVHAVERVMHRGDPRARAKATTANTRAAHAGRTASHANTHARSVGHALNSYKARSEPRIAHATHAVDVTLPREIGRVRRREDALSRDLGKLRERTKSLEDGAVDTWEWIRSHPFTSVTAAFAGAVALALSRIGYGFLRCRSWQQVGKRLTCGTGASLLGLLEGGLGDLLGALLTVEAVANFRELVEVGQSVEHGVAEGIKELLNVAE